MQPDFETKIVVQKVRLVHRRIGYLVSGLHEPQNAYNK